jgi:elongation factor 1 alpha-like protein
LQADNNINLVIIGHVDSGKSTLTGHLLFKLGEISKEVIRKNVKKTEEFKKAGFEFAYIMDDTEEE